MAIIFVSGLAFLGYYWYTSNQKQPSSSTDQAQTNNQPASSANVLFSSNFDNESDLQKWEIFDDNVAQEGPSNWFFEDGALKQDSNIWAGTFGSPVKDKSYLGSMIVTKDGQTWEDYQAKFKFKPLDNDGVGFIVRYVDRNNYLRIFTIQDPTQNNGGPKIKIDKRVNGKTYGLFVKKFTYNTGQWNEVTIKVKGEKITFIMNNEKKKYIWAETKSFKTGRFGFSVYAEEGVEFDDVVIEKR